VNIFSLSKKRLTSLGVFLLLLIAIPLSLYLIQKQQIFKGRATPNSSIDILGPSGNVITTTANKNVQLKLTYGTTPVQTETQCFSEGGSTTDARMQWCSSHHIGCSLTSCITILGCLQFMSSATPGQNVGNDGCIIGSSPGPGVTPTPVAQAAACHINGPDSFSATTGANYSLVETNVTCGASPYPAPGSCRWNLVSPHTLGIVLQDRLSNKTTLSIKPEDNVPPDTYNLTFARLIGAGLSTLLCTKNVTVN